MSIGTESWFLSWRWWLGMRSKLTSQPPSRKLSITVLIPAYNEERSIAGTMHSIRRQTVVPDHIIVVDDCSTDDTARIAREWGATVLKTPRNQGTKAQAQNYALDHINTDLFVTVDADTRLEKDAIEKTLPYFNDPKTCAVCGFVVPQRISTLWERGRFVEYILGFVIFKGAQNHIGTVMVSSGCFSVFKTDLVKEFGGFNERTSAEDMDLTWELLGAGYRVYYAPNAHCYPIEPPTRRIFINQIDRWYRGFLQNIAVRRGNIWKQKRLGFIVYGYLLEFAIAPVLLVWFAWYTTESVIGILAVTAAVSFIFVFVPVVMKGWQLGILKKVLTSFPCYFLVRAVNIGIFWRSIWREWILHEKLTVWHKGH